MERLISSLSEGPAQVSTSLRIQLFSTVRTMPLGYTFQAGASGHLVTTDAKVKEANSRLANKGVSVSRIDSRNATLQIVDENVASAAMAKEETIGHKEKPVETDLQSKRIRVSFEHKTTEGTDGQTTDETLVTVTRVGISGDLARKIVNFFIKGL
ncbi:uncharacterized protein [Dermacentor andersoni]|uniref:uncharacterized protein n=1 Tax=Dermacentor andersoni TaxID=34620 RepID=UPI0024173F90|nr:uncharacterized protein LOC129381331 [Dermacentor andersoni]